MICPQFTHKIQEMPLQKNKTKHPPLPPQKKPIKSKTAGTKQGEGTSQLKQQDYALHA